MDDSIQACHIHGQGVMRSLWVSVSSFVKRNNKQFCTRTASERINWGNIRGKHQSIRGMLAILPVSAQLPSPPPRHVGSFSAGHVPPPPALNPLCIPSIVLYFSHHCDYLILSLIPQPTCEVLDPRGIMCFCSKPDKMGTQT